MPVNYRIDPITHYTVMPNGCMRWSGATNGNGYGQIKRLSLKEAAHRFFYRTLVGEIPAGKVIDHLCRNPRCVNPSHLEPVSNGENILRGINPVADNARKTHCPRGHLYDDSYTLKTGINQRRCKTCKHVADLAYKQRKRAPQPPQGEG